jgi:hypothetical protein
VKLAISAFLDLAPSGHRFIGFVKEDEPEGLWGWDILKHPDDEIWEIYRGVNALLMLSELKQGRDIGNNIWFEGDLRDESRDSQYYRVCNKYLELERRKNDQL